MTLGEKLKAIRLQCGLSQDAIGSQGFVSTPGWIKLEHGKRAPSEPLIEQLVAWLLEQRHINSSTAKSLREELFTLKYLGSHSVFVRELARRHAQKLPNGHELLIQTVATKPRRGRPKMTVVAPR